MTEQEVNILHQSMEKQLSIYTVYFKEEITYAVEIKVKSNIEDKSIIEIARKEIEDNGRENYSVDTSGLTESALEKE